MANDGFDGFDGRDDDDESDSGGEGFEADNEPDFEFDESLPEDDFDTLPEDSLAENEAIASEKPDSEANPDYEHIDNIQTELVPDLVIVDDGGYRRGPYYEATDRHAFEHLMQVDPLTPHGKEFQDQEEEMREVEKIRARKGQRESDKESEQKEDSEPIYSREAFEERKRMAARWFEARENRQK